MRGRLLREHLGYVSLVVLALIVSNSGEYPVLLLGYGFVGLATRNLTRASHERDILLTSLVAIGIATVAWLTQLPAFVVTASITCVVAAKVSSGYIGQSGVSEPDSTAVEYDGFLVFVLGASAALVATVVSVFLIGETAAGSAGGTVASVLSGALVAAVLKGRSEDEGTWVVLVATSFCMGGIAVLPTVSSLSWEYVGVAAAVVVLFGFVSYVSGVITETGSLAGGFLAFVAVTVGGYGWLVVLGSFVVCGAVSTKYGYEEKLAAGVIDDEDARRGLRNVAANGTVPLVAVVAFGMAPLVEAASTNWTVIAKLVFAGSVATVTADTLSSEIGSVHGEPRLITTFEKVPKGTDGGVSWQGEAVVLLSSVLIGAVCVGTGFVGLSESVWVFLGGVGGAHADSVLGATVEGSYRYVDNHVVNLTASVVGSTVSVLAYLLF